MKSDEAIEKIVDKLWGSTFKSATATVGQRDDCKARYRDILKDSLRAEPRQAAFDAMLEALKPFAETICEIDCGVEEIGCPREDCDYRKARAAIALAANVTFTTKGQTKKAKP